MSFVGVAAKKVVKMFGRQRALAGVDLELAPGKLCALLGPNGAGKSTLVGVLSTLVRPTSGEVAFESQGAKLEPRQVRAAIGVLAHESFIYGELTAVENLRFYAALYDVREAAKRADQVLDEMGLDAEARARPARTYSRGMLQRLALARALLHEPKLLLLDEPFTGLDRSGMQALARVLGESRANGRFVLVVTHDLDAIGGIADHVVVLKRGRVVLDERSAEGFKTEDLKERYHRFVD